MSPRRYTMSKRTALVAGTRQRIVEATLDLHGRKGIFGTSWQDIADEADVAVGTVYKHFPSLEDLLPACGDLLMQRIRPPSPDEADAVVAGAVGPTERLYRVANELFAFYERGGSHLESDLRERELPAMREWEHHLRGMVARFVRVALTGGNLNEDDVRTISVLFDFPTYRAMRARGLALGEAVERAVGMAVAWNERGGSGKRSHGQQTGRDQGAGI